ncbi:hypothetical protein [Ktedonobacter racemifer]|nr:hypothetical protein [Ktedonobacter racemifer]
MSGKPSRLRRTRKGECDGSLAEPGCHHTLHYVEVELADAAEARVYI